MGVGEWSRRRSSARPSRRRGTPTSTLVLLLLLSYPAHTTRTLHGSAMLCPSQPRHLSIDTSFTASRNSAVHALWSNALAAPLMTLAHGVERRGCESREAGGGMRAGRRDPTRRAAESHMVGRTSRLAFCAR